MTTISKDACIMNLTKIFNEANAHNNGFHYEMLINEWNVVGKSRTYFAIRETRDFSTHCKKQTYGYYNNLNNEYVGDKYGNLGESKLFTFSGVSLN